MSWRVAFAIAAASTAAGCASASETPGDAPPGGKSDAPRGNVDAPHQLVDAPHHSDAGVPPDGPPAMGCTTSATCANPTVLSGIGGDETGASTSGATGYQAAWYSIRVSETDSGPFGDPMSMQVSLTSPSTAMFDLTVYVPGDASSTNCTTPTSTVTTSGTTETWTLEWGETGTFANGVDDSRTVAIEITPRSGDTCASADTWSMSIFTGFD